MGNGFPIWFGIAAGIVGFALAEEVTNKTENNTPTAPQVKSVFFSKPKMEINLGAIGKGYALDKVKSLLLNKFGSRHLDSMACGDWG